jgi:predicted transcriptional regulator
LRVAEEIEISTIDLRYESYRMRNPALEARLLASIVERGIEEPLEGVGSEQRRILLNGFKRYRCAAKLGFGLVPYTTIGQDEASGIIAMLRVAKTRSLNILEEARFLDDLRRVHQLSIAEIAEVVSRSKSWVSMRLGLLEQMDESVREKLLAGAFPVYSYMYTLRPLMRMNRHTKKEVEDFVAALSGKRLSVREISQLAHGYFGGPEWFRQEIHSGHFGLALDHLKCEPAETDQTTAPERALLKDLELVGKHMRGVMLKCPDRRLQSPAFRAEMNLLAAGLLSRLPAFSDRLKELYARSGDTQGDLPPLPARDAGTPDQP